MTNKLLTIVVPVYKVEQYINKCLDSCIIYKADGSLDEDKMNQLEVIIVNDGTPDRSAELSREYTIRYPQTFRQIDKENGGHGSAWNVGLKEATGKYLRFLDSDDWLTNLDRLMSDLNNTNVDLIFTQRKNCYVSGITEEVKFVDKCDIVIPIEDFPIVANGFGNMFDFWYVTYKRELLDYDLPLFLEHCSYDDDILFVAPIYRAKTYENKEYVLYNYLLGRPGQSVDPIMMKKQLNFLVMNHMYLSTFRLEDFEKLTEGKKKLIKNIIAFNARFLFWDLLWFGYSKCKYYMSIFDNQTIGTEFELSGKAYKRYKSLPFFIFYWLEKFRKSSLYQKSQHLK